jgi:hypothetical protein
MYRTIFQPLEANFFFVFSKISSHEPNKTRETANGRVGASRMYSVP